jgi:hypothetical protein
MSPSEIEAILASVAQKQTPASVARGQLEAAGWSAGEAEEAVFGALGGGDLVEIGADGSERYKFSGRRVSEVEAEMRK